MSASSNLGKRNWKADLDRLLTANVGKPARERLTLIRLFEELRALGYEGGYDAVRRYARDLWNREHASQTAAAFRAVVVRARVRPTSSTGATRSL